MEVEVPTKKLGGSLGRRTLLHTQLLLCVVHAATNSCGPGLAFLWAPSITDDVVHGRLEGAHTSAIASFRQPWFQRLVNIMHKIHIQLDRKSLKNSNAIKISE